MPKYKYYCDACLVTFEAWHSIKDVLSECSKCGASNCLTRVPSMVSDFKKPSGRKKVGDLTDEYIEENRKELEKMKKQTTNRDIEE
tara:strand:- start:612 stop:869 length:258 start_codon:yes stop_codon:yes gene_type:complete